MNANKLVTTASTPSHGARTRRINRPSVILIVLFVLGVSPFILGGRFFTHMAILTCLNIVMVSGLSLIARTGQLSLGHGAFAGLGAYCFVALFTKAGLPFVVSIFLGVCFAAVIAYLLGKVILRLRGVYFVLVTFAFAEFIRLVMLDWEPITGGASGIAGIPPAAIFSFVFESQQHSYALALACAVLCTVFLNRFFGTPAGHAFDAVGENFALAEATGLSERSIQMKAFVMGSAMTAFGGALLASYIGFVSPESFNVGVSISMVVMLVAGGLFSVWGPVVGALIMTPLPELFRGAVQAQHLLYGIALIAILRFLPSGFASVPSVLRNRRQGKRK